MAILHNVLIFGGTFDPIHQGHLLTAIAIQKHFNFEQVIFLPCKIPLLKNNATASAQQRLEMLTLAIDEQDAAYHFKTDARELERKTPSYMVTTLEDLRRQWTDDRSITLLMGIDTFYQIPQWHKWQKLLTLCHLLVIDRPGVTLEMPDEIPSLLKSHSTNDVSRIKHTRNGLILRYNAGHYDLSSCAIREKLVAGVDVSEELPPVIVDYIAQNRLYRTI